MSEITDFLIIGQGLAGSLLSFNLLKANKRIIVIDDPAQTKATNVAAGIINPVVFRRMTKSWMVDVAFQETQTTYRQLEEVLDARLYSPCKILKPLNEEQCRLWKAKVDDNKLHEYLERIPSPEAAHGKNIKAGPWGVVKKAARVNLQLLVGLWGDHLAARNLRLHERFDHSCLRIEAGSVNYKHIQAQKIIFCEGASASRNPFFQTVQFMHSKGEVLDVTIPGLDLGQLISDQVFLMPTGDNSYKVGATYRWDELDDRPTSAARTELLQKLGKLVSIPLSVVNQRAGIRPTTLDRKPVAGLLPHQQQIGIFNGLGPKGALLGPVFARQFAQYLSGDSIDIHPETDLRRFFKQGQ